MTKVESYCACHKNHTLVQTKNETTSELGDEVCTPVDVPGVDCSLDGYNVTISDLEGLLTDRPAPITVPLDPEELAKKEQPISNVQLKSDEGDAPSEEELKKEEEKKNSSKTAANEAFDTLAKVELKKEGVKEKVVEGKIKDPMENIPIDLMMKVGGSKVDLT